MKQERRFGRLTVLSVFSQTGQHGARLLCLCDCGVVKDFRVQHLLKGLTQSCGCLRRERIYKACRKHGHARHGARTPEYRTYNSMIQRCQNPRTPYFKNYGGRGIRVCDRWKNSFEAFLVDMGPRPLGRNGQVAAYSIERVNNDGNYEPDNCKWATKKEQRANQRSYSQHSSGTHGPLLR